MPIYEYRCRRCQEDFQVLIMKRDEIERILCPSCGQKDISRVISRVAYHVSAQDRVDSYDPGARQNNSFYKDSRNIGLHAQKRARQMGVDLGSGFEEKLEKLRTKPGSVLDTAD